MQEYWYEDLFLERRSRNGLNHGDHSDVTSRPIECPWDQNSSHLLAVVRVRDGVFRRAMILSSSGIHCHPPHLAPVLSSGQDSTNIKTTLKWRPSNAVSSSSEHVEHMKILFAIPIPRVTLYLLSLYLLSADLRLLLVTTFEGDAK